MTTNADSNLPPSERVHDIPRILEAMRQAVQEALLDHKRAGNPVAIWKDGRVEWVQPRTFLTNCRQHQTTRGDPSVEPDTGVDVRRAVSVHW